jgi:hypothetical protein
LTFSAANSRKWNLFERSARRESGRKKEERDIGEIFLLTVSSIAYLPSPLNKRRHDYEAQDFKEKDRATREASGRGLKETGQAETKNAVSTGSEGDESREEIGCPRSSGEETSHRQESEAKAQSLTGTSRATFGCDESQMGRQESRWGECENRIER